MLNIIAAISENNVISVDNNLPWHYSEDLKYFKLNTCGLSNKNAIIMGYNTYISLKNRPLPNRINIVIDRSSDINTLTDIRLDIKVFYFVNNLNNIIEELKLNTFVNDIWIIGGEKIYYETINRFDIDALYITKINLIYPTNDNSIKYFPSYEDNYNLISLTKPEKEQNLTFLTYKRKSSEYQYLKLINNILLCGINKTDRTGTGTLSFFGSQSRYNLINEFPLLTTKKMFFRGIFEELLWFLKGQTNANILKDKKVNIWNQNTTREYLDSIGLNHYKEGECGPIYGFNFRHFGAKYINCDNDYTGQGFDQFINVINLLKNKPNSRRIIINLWNPNDLDKVCLPPCHVLYQFWVDGDKLSCSMYQRSGDVGLGVPFNIASASLLTYIVANLTNLKPFELIHSIGDNHIYNDHIDALKEQVKRIPHKFPKMEIEYRNQKNIEDFVYEDFKLDNYVSHPPIKMSMS